MAGLITEYRLEVIAHNRSTDKFYQDQYEAALMRTLKTYGSEDENEHGRLISIKDTLLNVNQTEIRDKRYACLFYQKDLRMLKKAKSHETNETGSTEDTAMPNDEEVRSVVQKRT
jgi:hypothetical protein